MSEGFDHLLGVVFLIGGLSAAMVWLAARMNLLEQREKTTRCPSCGVIRRRGVCSCGR
jgi:hypothetical protein